MSKWDYIVEEMHREDDGIFLDEAYHRTKREQLRAETGGNIEGFPFISDEDGEKILNRLLAKGKITSGNPSCIGDNYVGEYRQKYGSKPIRPRGSWKDLQVQDFGEEDIVRYALENPEEAEIFGDKRFRDRMLNPKQHQLAYGRNEREIQLDIPCFEWIERKGRRFGLNVDVEYGPRRAGLYKDSSVLDYASFEDLNAVVKMFRIVSSIFRKPPNHSVVIPPKKERQYEDDSGKTYIGVDYDFCMRYIEKELDREFSSNGGKLKMPWGGNMVNGQEIDPKYNFVDRDSATDTARSILKKIAWHESFDGFGMFTGGRIVTKQQDADEDMKRAVEKDIEGFAEYMKQDGYHVGVHWTSDHRGWLDPGETVEGMGVVLFNGEIPISSVDWAKTVATNEQFPNENELWLHPGRPILHPVCTYCSDRIRIRMRPMDENLCLIA